MLTVGYKPNTVFGHDTVLPGRAPMVAVTRAARTRREGTQGGPEEGDSPAI